MLTGGRKLQLTTQVNTNIRLMQDSKESDYLVWIIATITRYKYYCATFILPQHKKHYKKIYRIPLFKRKIAAFMDVQA